MVDKTAAISALRRMMPTPGFKPDAAAERGVVVAGVESCSGADRAGLVNGTSVLAVNNQPVKDATHFASLLASMMPGDTVKLQIKSGQTVSTALVELGAVPSATADTSGERVRSLRLLAGLSVAEDS